MSILNAYATQNLMIGHNRRDQTVVGHRVEEGSWAGRNLATGAQFEAERLNDLPGDASHWGVSRTGPNGVETYNDFTVTRDAQNRVRVHDLNRSGFQPLPAEEGRLGERESFQSSIVGDPHFSLSGSVNGEQKDVKFDNQDLGSRTQFAGAGFELETETVPWGEGGAAVVGEATVRTGFGRAQDEVTLSADGTLSVNGQATTLESGETLDLNRTSSVTMGEDGAYTVSSRNGKVSNTMTANDHSYGNYINIESSVNNVQTVGWLQNQEG